MGLFLSSGKRDFILDPPFTNVSGMLGFSDETRYALDLSVLGGFITNPISLSPRTPANPPRLIPFDGGFLLHTGHPNPGLNQVLRHHERRWQEMPCTVIAHLLAQNPQEVAQMVERMEDVESVAALELGLEGPDAAAITDLVTAAVHGELPVMAQIPLDCDEDIVKAITDSGVVALCLGPPRGSLPGPDGNPVDGRLFGPALFPLALHAIMRLRPLLDLPLIGSGGLHSRHQAETMLAAGADAVQFDSVLWTAPDAVLRETQEGV
jgi:dihydroorotate dehydrogenase (NAD+) catalytic subunit